MLKHYFRNKLYLTFCIKNDIAKKKKKKNDIAFFQEHI